MKPEHIRLFVKPWCGWCREAQAWLDEKGIRYDLIDVAASRAGRQEMRELSGQTLAPVIEVDGQILADFDTDQLALFWKQFEQNERERN
jgi:glutaredoxin